MSHTSQDRMRELVAMIRGVEKDTGRPIGILVDLQGPKLRLGTFAGGSAMVEKARASCSIAIRRRATPRAPICRIRKSSPRSRPGARC